MLNRIWYKMDDKVNKDDLNFVTLKKKKWKWKNEIIVERIGNKTRTKNIRYKLTKK